jgi:polynucleotide 5'-triphosphatase
MSTRQGSTKYPQSMKRKSPEEEQVRLLFDEPTYDGTAIAVYHLLKDKIPTTGTVEVEAKLGLLIDKRSNQRLRLSMVGSESVLLDDHSIRFVPDMTMQHHATFNRLLNKLVSDGKLKYTHRKETDRFYTPKGQPRIRETIDTASGKSLAVITKEKIRHINIYSPLTPFDIRISLSREAPAEMEKGLAVQMERHKDRMSYENSNCHVDLTQVKSLNEVILFKKPE